VVRLISKVAAAGAFLLAGLTWTARVAAAQGNPNLFRQPDIGRAGIVFVYGGDLWLAPPAGGIARRLTANPSNKAFPKFSPDGKWIAFTGNYDGNTDVYLIPAEGGEPKRLTYHPSPSSVLGWAPDSKAVLFRSGRTSFSGRFDKAFTVPITGGMPTELPVPEVDLAALSPDGNVLAYTRTGREFATWKRYRGGDQAYISLYDIKNNRYSEVPHGPETNYFPMWRGDKIYFASDKSLTVNLYVYDLRSKAIRQLTHFNDYDIKWPSLGPDSIVFEHGGRIEVLDLATEKVTPISIQAYSDMTAARPRLLHVENQIHSMDISPSGARAVFEARGDLFTVPAKKGDCRNISHTSDAREINPAWSPDGKYIAYLSDKSGEYEIYIRPQDGSGTETRVTNDGHVYRNGPIWSPDSKALLYTDVGMHLWMVTLADKKPALVDSSTIGELPLGSWSPDSKWIAYTKPNPNHFNSLMLYSVDKKQAYTVGDGRYSDREPVFDQNGKYLYFLSDRTFLPTLIGPEININFQNTTGIYALVLRADTPSPFAPESDEEKPKDESAPPPGPPSADTASSDPQSNVPSLETPGFSVRQDGRPKAPQTGNSLPGAKPAAKPSGPEPVKIDLDGLYQRTVGLPVPAGSYGGLSAGSGKLFYMAGGDLHRYAIADREDKVILSGIQDYALNPAGTKILYRAGRRNMGILAVNPFEDAAVGPTFGIVDAAPGQTVGAGRLSLNLEMLSDPRAEWKEMFWDAWRLERDFYYDPNMHGLDWKAIGDRYARLLPGVAHRDDLTYLLGEVIGELDTSHAYVFAGGSPGVPPVSIGLLGVDFEPSGSYYRIKKIYRGENWDADTRSPLTEPGVKVKEGDYLIAVNGIPLHTDVDPYSLFLDTVGKTVTLRVNSQPSDSGAHDVQVRPISSETELRHLDWEEANRKKVELATGGRIGYMYVPDTAFGGLTAFGREFYSQSDKEGIIVDERFNSGGFIPDFFVEKLTRRLLSMDTSRYGRDNNQPGAAIYGPRVILANEWAGSGGDAFPYYFRKAGAGPIIGKRTWGGLVGINGLRPLLDGGGVTVPGFGIWSPQDGKWIAENHGIDPDIEVNNTPDLVREGHDPQLERAIAYELEQLRKNPPPTYHHPPFPVEHLPPIPPP